ncbi:tetratricopeptide repeat protein [candidate division KSB1 bacterium]|nr:tetratricopeptide repeat protein [candidate division KSB1 bacterium]
MMDTTRIEKLKKSLDANPSDAFTRYLVALECVKLRLNDEAIAHFQQLVNEHPQYVPTYYQYAQLLENLQRQTQAIAIYEAGLNAARTAGDTHAASELQAALDLLI